MVLVINIKIITFKKPATTFFVYITNNEDENTE